MSSDQEVARARDEYQLAVTSGNMPAARLAMLRAVQVRDDSVDLWLDLGRAQLALNDLNGAYYSYSRASELDRANTEALQVLADTSILAGKVRDAERYASELQLLRPGAAGPLTTRGFIDLAKNDPDAALTKAEEALTKRPFDPTASVLKARALAARSEFARGAAVLEAQMAARGQSRSVLTTLLKLYRSADDARAVLATKARLSRLVPADDELALNYAGELYRADDDAAARTITVRLSKGRPDPKRLDEILSLWRTHETREQSLRNVAEAVLDASYPARVQYAGFYIGAGRPDMAEALMRANAALPVEAARADAIAMYARARAAQGHVSEALPLLDAVLRFDPRNDQALRARTDLDLAGGCPEATLSRARQLTVSNPKSAEDRVRLAKCYEMRGNRSLSESTYWTAFREIPGNPLLYESLSSFLKKSGAAGATELVARRFEEQKRALAASELAKG